MTPAISINTLIHFVKLRMGWAMRVGVMMVGLLVLTLEVWGQSFGDYRTVGNVNFSSSTNWEYYDGFAWNAAIMAPTSINNIITIRNGHTATLTANITLNQVVVESGGILVISNGKKLTLSNGIGNDLSVYGTLNNSGWFSIKSGANIVFYAGSIYNHKQDGGSIPTATWDAASNCNITGIVGTTFSSGLNQNFGNFTWNCPSQINPISISGLGNGGSIQGDFNILSTGGSYINLADNSTQSFLSISNNYIQTGGTIYLTAGSKKSTINIGQDFNFSGGTLGISGSNTSSGFVFNNTSTTQNFRRSGGTISGNVNFTVNPNVIIDFGTNDYADGGGTFTLSGGATLQTANADGINGSIKTSNRSLSTSANYIFDSTNAQATGTYLPSTVKDLAINNSSGVTLTNSVWVNGNAYLQNGILNTAVDVDLYGTPNCGSGSINATAGTVTYESTATNIFPGTYNNLIINAGNPVFCGNFNVNGTLTANNNLSFNNSGCFGNIKHTAGTVIYSGTSYISPGSYNNLSISSGTALLCGDITVNGNLTVSSGAILQLAGKNFTINGTSLISGTLANNAASTTNLFKGLVTINAGGIWDFSSGNPAVELQGGLTNNGTFTSGTGMYSFTTNSQSIAGSSPITFDGNFYIYKNVSVTNTNLASGTGITLKGEMNGYDNNSKYINQGITSYEYANDVPMSPGTIDASYTGNIFRYSGGTQNISSDDYYNLVITGSNSKTFSSSINVNGYLTVDGTTLTFGGGDVYTLDVKGNLYASNGTIDMDNGTNINHILKLEGENNSCNLLNADDQSEVQYIGGDGQQVFASSNYRNITFGGGGTKILQGDVTASGNAITLSANVDINSHLLFFNNPSGTISRTAGAVIGNFQWAVGQKGKDYIFPVGTSSSYNPVTVNFADLTPGNLSGEYTTGEIGNTGLPLYDVGDEIYESDQTGYWALISDNSLASSNYSVTLDATGFTGIDNSSRIIKRTNGGALTIDGLHGSYTSPYISRTACNGISTGTIDFAIGHGHPYITTQPSDQTVCEGTSAQFSVTAEGQPALTYQWQEKQSSGGWNDISDGGIYSGAKAATLTLSTPPSAMSGYQYQCIVKDGAGHSVTSNSAKLMVNPTAEVEQPGNQIVCNGGSTSAVTFTTANTGGATTYTWTNDNTTIGLGANGTGDIPTFTAKNNGTTPVTATITVTPHFENGGLICDGPTKSFTITVNPTAAVEQPGNQIVCNGGSTSAVNFTTANTGGATTYTWTNDNTTIGLGANGTGDIPTFTAKNNGTTPVTATITVTPHFENGGLICDGSTKSFTITVNPTAEVEQPGNQIVCNGGSTSAVTFTTANTGGATTYTWTNDNTTIGLGANGTGDIPTFTAKNNGTTPVTATITVTPHFENGGLTCDGSTKSFTITVNPTAAVEQPGNQIVCNGGSTSAVTFSTANTGGTTTYTWTNNNTTIGLGGSGTGNITSFNAVNNTNDPITATIEVTPHFTNGGLICDGQGKSFTITVNPTAEVEQPGNQTVCNEGSTTTVTFSTANTGGTTTYSWTNNTPSIGLVFSGTGDIPTFTATNSSTTPVTATIVVTPHFENDGITCDGPTKSFTITVNPTAEAEQPTSQVLCNGSNTTAINFTTANTGGTTTYSWTNDTPSIGLNATGNGDIPSFTAQNNGTSPVTATITVTPHFENGGVTCDGPSKSFTITVNPTAEVEQPGSQVVCNEGSTSAVTFSTANTGGTTTYSWTNNTPSIGIAASGTGDIPTFTATNSSTTPVTATIIVTPHFTNDGINCDGPTKSFTITVNPTAEVEQPGNQIVCNGGSTSAVTFATVNTGGATTYTWTNDNTTIGLGANGTGDITSFNAVNNTNGPITATIEVTPHFTNGGITCDGPIRTFKITVNPTPLISPVPANAIQCDSATTNIILQSPSSFTSGNVTFEYSATATGGVKGYTTSATGLPNGYVIEDKLVNPTDAPQTVTYVITPLSPTGCNSGVSQTVTVTINPTPRINPVPVSTIQCDNTTTNIVLQSPSTFTSGDITFKFTATTTGGISGYTSTASGLQNGYVISDKLVNLTDAFQTVTYIITPVSPTGCNSGASHNVVVTVNPTPRLNISYNDSLICDSSQVNFNLKTPSITTGKVRYKLQTAVKYGSGLVDGVENNGVKDVSDFSNTLTNKTDSLQVIQYTFRPFIEKADGYSDCSAGHDTVIRIYLNPTAKMDVSPNDTIVCDSSQVSFDLKTSIHKVMGEKTYQFARIYDHSEIKVSEGHDSNNEFLLPDNLTDGLVNLDTSVHIITYRFYPSIRDTRPGHTAQRCHQGVPHTWVVRVNPTARLNVFYSDTILCDSSKVTLTVRSGNGLVSGNKKYILQKLYSEDSLFTAFAPDTFNINPSHTFTDSLVNRTSSVQKIIYRFIPRIQDSRNTHYDCHPGAAKDLAVWVNPKSRIRVEIPDTIFCDSSRIVFNLHTLNGKVLGNKAYNLRKMYYTDSIHSTLEAKDYGIDSPAALSDTLINKTASYQVIRYTFTPYIEDNRPGYGAHRCYQDKDTSIVVYVNPLPSIKVEAQDTLCNETAVKFNISSRNGSVKGDKMYYLTTLQPDSLSGAKVTGTYPVENFTDTLINHSPHLKSVAYHFIAQIKDNRPGHNDFCLIGRDTTLNLRVNPTPGISSWAIRDFVCYQEGSTLHVSTPNTNTGQWAYDVHSSTSDTKIIGFRQATDTSVFSFNDPLRNNGDTVQYVYYHFVPSILHPSSKIASCESGIADTTVVMVAPKIVLTLRKDTMIGGWSVSCNGSTDGKIHLGVRGGYHPSGYHYSWSRSTTGSDGFNVSSQNQANVRSGLYTALVTDNIGCQTQDTIRLKQPPALVTEIVRQKDISCAAHSDGALRAKVNGGTPAYRLSWAGPNHTSWGNVYTIYNLPEGPYTLTAVDTNKCVSTYSMKFTSPADVTSALNPTPVTCFGGSNGTFSPVFGGGSTIVSYSWTGPEGYSSSRRNIEQLKAGFYKLKVTNSDGCYYEFGDSIKQPFKISATLDTSYYPPYNISCYGSTDGFIKLSQIRGGRGNQYKFEWADNSDTSFIAGTTSETNLPAGIFYIKMIDTAKCSVIDTISLHQPDSLILNNQISDYHGRQISCAGQEDGYVHLSPSGGFGTYTYSWTGPGNAALKPNEQNQDSLIAGQYNLTLTYGGRCAKNWTFNLTEPQKLKLNPVISDYSGYAINCQGYNSGSVHLNATGGTPEYIYDWQTNGGSGLVKGDSLQDKLTAGAYSVVVNDLNNCSVRDTFLLQQPDSMKVSSWSTDMTCNPGNDGTITITSAGGVSPYVYNWGDGYEGSKHTGLSAGIYHIQVSDKNSCQAEVVDTINVPPGISLSLNVTKPYNDNAISCHGMSDGKILASVNGGKAPFTFSWNTGKTTQDIENIPAGHYELTVSDSNRCTAQASADVNEPPSLKVELSLNQVSCHSYSDGQASAFLSGGVQPYSLLWSTGSNETSIYRLKAGSYTLQTSDYNKCRLDTSFIISQPDTLSVRADITSPYCPDSYDGAITIQPAGGTWPYRTLWGRGDAGESINQVGDSLYTVKITDAHNCIFVDSISVSSIKGNCLSIPNTFTPNGDGYNDTWEIDHMDLYPKAIVEIYNRWGILLFRSRPGYPDKWDGTWKGKVLPMDSYFYVIDVHNGSKPSTGSVTIIK